MNKKLKKIGIFSGKGGVGKTSITASLAVLFHENQYQVLAVDTDVDAPNLAILFQANSTPIEELTVQTTEKATFLEDQCVHCKQCITDNFCHFNALKWNSQEEIPVIDNVACEGCHACQYLCPQHAFDIRPVNSGHINHLNTRFNFDVITGETILGSQTSGKLVSELKRYAMTVSEKQNTEIILVDGPPGIGCPVIAAMTDLDYIIVVIEPTSAALHDAKRLLELNSSFKIPFSIIINKVDMYPEGLKKIETYLQENDIPILGRIPLNPNWPKAIAQAKPIVSFEPQGISTQSLRNILSTLEKNVLK